MILCPTCGNPGGVQLFTSIAPCDKCYRPSASEPSLQGLNMEHVVEVHALSARWGALTIRRHAPVVGAYIVDRWTPTLEGHLRRLPPISDQEWRAVRSVHPHRTNFRWQSWYWNRHPVQDQIGFVHLAELAR